MKATPAFAMLTLSWYLAVQAVTTARQMAPTMVENIIKGRRPTLSRSETPVKAPPNETMDMTKLRVSCELDEVIPALARSTTKNF